MDEENTNLYKSEKKDIINVESYELSTSWFMVHIH